jgi:hypothetical protein
MTGDPHQRLDHRKGRTPNGPFFNPAHGTSSTKRIGDRSLESADRDSPIILATLPLGRMAFGKEEARGTVPYRSNHCPGRVQQMNKGRGNFPALLLPKEEPVNAGFVSNCS